MEPDLEAAALAYRDEFPILKQKTYLISASLGPLSNRSRSYLEEFLDLWQSVGSPDVVWFENVFPTYDRVRELLAELVGANPSEIALQPNISTALSSVASFFDYRERPRVVISELDFPTDHHVWQAQERRGVELVKVASRDGVTIETEDFLDAIDERTALVQVNRVLYQSGAILDLETISAAAHENGAFVLVDDFHGAGVLPIRLWEQGADFYTTGVLKWLCGGGGLAFLLVRSDLIERFSSQVTGWWANRPESYFSPNTDLAGDARRFETGTTAAAVAYTALGGLEIVTEFGPERIRERQKSLTSHVVDRALEKGFQVASPLDASRRGGLVRIRVEDSKRVFRSLLDQDIVVDERAGGLRIAPHFFNTTEEIDTLFSALPSA